MARMVPPRFNEGWGTWHPKIYGADDTLIISGYGRMSRHEEFTRFLVCTPIGPT